jgi:hypothetical protein
MMADRLQIKLFSPVDKLAGEAQLQATQKRKHVL